MSKYPSFLSEIILSAHDQAFIQINIAGWYGDNGVPSDDGAATDAAAMLEKLVRHGDADRA
jgi:hypothetical protein